jgi:hypothetical protein
MGKPRRGIQRPRRGAAYNRDQVDLAIPPLDPRIVNLSDTILDYQSFTTSVFFPVHQIASKSQSEKLTLPFMVQKSKLSLQTRKIILQ